MNCVEFPNGVIYNEDCMKVFKEIPSESIDLIVTDPPYPTMSRGNSGNSGGMLQKDVNKKGKVFKFNDIDCEKFAPEFYRVLKDGSHCYVMTNHINLVHMLNVFTGVGFHFIKSLIWDKGNKIMGQFYMSQDDTDYDEVCGGFPVGGKNGDINKRYKMDNTVYGEYGYCNTFEAYDDSGSASRYFYCSKASKKDRDEGLGTSTYDLNDSVPKDVREHIERLLNLEG